MLANYRIAAVLKAVSAALGIALLCTSAALAAAAHPRTAYDSDPGHLWNQLSATLFARQAPEGKTYGLDELDILYWEGTEHLLTGPSHSAAIRVLDRFIRAHAERLVREPYKRALLQRDLWQLFDWAARPGETTHPTQRAELEDRLAIVIRRLALTDADIAALPDSYAGTPPDPDLPSGLFAPDGDWITARSNDSEMAALALRHTEAFRGHSVFLVMVRLPQGREQTVDYLNSLRDFEGPLLYARQHQLTLSPDVPQFPPGTEWALVRRLCVIDDKGSIRVTPLIESIQLRRYDSIEVLRTPAVAGQKPAQQMFAFEMDRLQDGALKAIGPSDVDFQFVQFMSKGGDPFELSFDRHDQTPNPTATRRSSLSTCYQCHSAPGIKSVASLFFFAGTVQRLEASAALPAQLAGYTPPPNAQLEAEATVAWKYRQFDWGLLQGLWHRAD